MTGWADDVPDDDLEDGEEGRSDGDILGDVRENGARQRRRPTGSEEEMPYTEQWEMDSDAFQTGTVRVQTTHSITGHSCYAPGLALSSVGAGPFGLGERCCPHKSQPDR